MSSARFLVGIDLGTTNTVVAFCELNDNLQQSPIEIFPVDQLVGPGEVLRQPLLPSFRYHPAPNQFSDADLTLPWSSQPVDGDLPQVIIGQWARELGAKIEGRQVTSAKSWLSHPHVDRTQPILPWGAAADVEQVSPLIASASYLNHIRQAWDHRHPSDQLAAQQVVVTVPASFDESARKLTLEAAKLAGLPEILLLEEPQAVCYDWHHRHQATASDILHSAPLILVCDVGGGTTDLSLIAAQFDPQQILQLNRIEVGDHLMLGGDNLDLALAHIVETRLKQQQGNQAKTLSTASLSKLIQQTRQAKERLLAANPPEQINITLLGSGSKLLSGAQSVSLSRAEVHQLALDGFFPLTSRETRPEKRRRAVVEFGLPYAADPAVSKHIAEFLSQPHTAEQTSTDNPSRLPTALLLNGGVFNSELIRSRLVTLLSEWLGRPVTLLDNPHPDWSVALGAVAYAKATRGAQLKIGGGAARSYFLHLPEKNRLGNALCLLAKGSREGQEIRLTSRRFALTVGEPVRFNLLTSTHGQISADGKIQNGALVAIDPDKFQPLPPYIVSLPALNTRELAANQKQRIAVQLACQLTEVGTLNMVCINPDDETQRWQVEFDVRGKAMTSPEQQTESVGDSTQLQAAKALISAAYSANKTNADQQAIKTLTKALEQRLGKRDAWDFATLRSLFDTLLLGRKRRRRSELHEKNWLRLAGFSLRPGFGDASDSWRIEQLWALYQAGIQFSNSQGWTDWWVLWRRVAGGLNQAQQETVLADIAKYLHPSAMRSVASSKETQDKGYEAMVRLAASLEHLHVDDKTLLATWFLNKALNHNQYQQAHWWACGRLAARTPLYGSLHTILPKDQIEDWLPKLLQQDWQQQPMCAFAVVMMCRKTGDRSRDVNEEWRAQVVSKLKQSRVSESWINLVSEVMELNANETQRAFGESLPHGLMLLG
ncbi:hsp70 family protein [Vibrio sp. HDW18]|uniref:Hsp70 family protein n=1 Tax=Vibrio sp. HDW18 TaxID=2714948 RepID=UPI001407C8CA|nr:Hsp70 family protein [Vibrio sp. HDW18]QIL84506.1 hsp70 family protein [Vibrio sp. HDW18]